MVIKKVLKYLTELKLIHASGTCVILISWFQGLPNSPFPGWYAPSQKAQPTPLLTPPSRTVAEEM